MSNPSLWQLKIRRLVIAKRQGLLDAFRERYNRHLDLSLQPSEHTLNLLVKVHQRRAADFVSLARVANMVDGRDLVAEPQSRTKLGKDLTLLIETKDNRKNSDYNSTSEAFAHAVKVLTMGYVLVSALDPPNPRGATWTLPNPIT